MRVGQQSFVVFSSNILKSLLGFVATLYIARELGAEILGFYAVIIALVAWLEMGGKLGISSALIKRISEQTAPAEHIGAAALAIFSFALVIAGMVYLLSDWVDAYVGVEATMFVIFLLFVGLFYALVTAVLKGQRLVYITGLLSAGRTGVRSIIQITVVFLGFGLGGLVLGAGIGAIVAGLSGLVFVSVGIARPQRSHFRSLFDFAKYSWLGTLKSRTFNDVDIVILGALVAPALVGIYAVAWSIAQFLKLFGDAIGQTMFPEMSMADAQDRKEYVATLVNDSLTYSGLLVIPGLLGGIILGDRLLRIYGDEFVQGTAVLGLLILAALFYSYQKQFAIALNGIDRPDIAFRINLIFIVTNAGLNVVLIYYMGWVGAAIASVVSALLVLILGFHMLRQLVRFTVPVDEISRQVFAAIIMAGVVIAVHEAIIMSELVRHNAIILVTLVGIGAAVYFAVLLFISTTFRRTIADNLPDPIPGLH